MPVGVPRGYSSRQEYAKEVLGMDIGGVMQQPSAFTQDESIGDFTPVRFLNVARPRVSTIRPSLSDISDANYEFSNEGKAVEYWKSLYAEKRKEYVDLWNKFDVAGDDDSKVRLNTQYQAMLDLRKKFNADYALTFDGQEAEGAVNLMANLGEEYTMEDLKSNRPLLESLQRTNGAYNNDGKLKTKDELLREWVKAQQLIEYNLGRIEYLRP